MRCLHHVLFFLALTTGLSAQGDFNCSVDPIEEEIGVGGARISWEYSSIKPLYQIENVSDSTFIIVDTLGRKLVEDTLIFIARKLDQNLMVKNRQGKWGVLNKEARPVLDLIYDDLSYETIQPKLTAMVKMGNKWGFVNDQQETVLPIEYKQIRMQTRDVAMAVKNGEHFLIFLRTRVVVPLGDQCVAIPTNLEGKGYCYVRDDAGKVGVLSSTGEYLIDPEFDEIQYVAKPLVQSGAGRNFFIVKQNGRAGLISETGKNVVPIIYRRIFQIAGILKLEHGNGESFRVFNGDQPSGITFMGKSSVRQDSLMLASRDNAICLYNLSSLEWIISPLSGYDEITWAPNDLLSIRKDGKYGLYDYRTGETLVAPQYNEPLLTIRDGLTPTSYLVLARKNKLFAFLDPEQGYQTVMPPSYHYVRAFSEGRARVMKDSKWGYIDDTFQLAIPLRYDYASAFKNGRAEVILNGKILFIDREGNCLSGCE